MVLRLVLDRHEAAWKACGEGLEGGAGWQVPAEWKPSGNASVGMITDAYFHQQWPHDMLTRIGTAMQLWRGDGQADPA